MRRERTLSSRNHHEGDPAGILSAVGGTPLVRLERVLPDAEFAVHAKLEALNPGGSIKDRPATAIVSHAIRNGLVIPGKTVVVESSSGNFAVGLAQACRYYGIDLICVVDPAATPQNLAILQAFGARVDLVRSPDPVTGDFLTARRGRVQQILAELPHAFWPNQYGSLLNPATHLATIQEVIEELDGPLDYLFCAVSTFGTLRGCAEYVRDSGLPTKVIAVDAVGSAIFGTPAHNRLIPGHGASVRPELFAPDLADDVVHITDQECVTACRRLVHHEAYLAGGSSGAVLAALLKYTPRIPAGANCVLIMPDRGERYLHSIYSDAWVMEHFGTLPDVALPPIELTVGG
ncbi:2,3-diaminopropionate biosynthesis protein SbnA [Streptomyces sp. NPDC058369]|uniref:2,3-diaminopropionate biosynthesis protein SbnA n=1 Tax=unclassified Streptomyces TaxID=2593676 RepID=UPI0022527DDD|nr:2,3-diaminopropionate biosynthesis protein SbnA [Streptomyces sp. NBC_01789]MCX4448241.1 2,3-diaminopropionate biosynthesis protein SbnA [Streptomyces sp. NBC_01789]